MVFSYTGDNQGIVIGFAVYPEGKECFQVVDDLIVLVNFFYIFEKIFVCPCIKK